MSIAILSEAFRLAGVNDTDQEMIEPSSPHTKPETTQNGQNQTPQRADEDADIDIDALRKEFFKSWMEKNDPGWRWVPEEERSVKPTIKFSKPAPPMRQAPQRTRRNDGVGVAVQKMTACHNLLVLADAADEELRQKEHTFESIFSRCRPPPTPR